MLTDQESIAQLASDLELALVAEYMAKTDAQTAASAAERYKVIVVRTAYEIGKIDGKNADIRRQQEAKVLTEAVPYSCLLDTQAELEMCAAYAEAERKAHDALIGLTKAWLYSQSGR